MACMQDSLVQRFVVGESNILTLLSATPQLKSVDLQMYIKSFYYQCFRD